MNLIEISPKIKIDRSLDFKNFSIINENNINREKILNIKLVFGGKEIRLKELFNVSVLDKDSMKKLIKIKGSNKNFYNVGANWDKDELRIFGDVGSFLGLKMLGGSIIVRGFADNFVGSQMIGGEIIIEKGAGDFIGSSSFGEKIGMSGGIIKINGNAGNFTAQYMRRGIIIINGNVGNNACDNMIAGNVVIEGYIGQNLCLGMKRGTVVVNKFKNKKAKNFVYCGIQDLNFYSILKNAYLSNNNYSNTFLKFVGDRYNNGIGEILVRL